MKKNKFKAWNKITKTMSDSFTFNDIVYARFNGFTPLYDEHNYIILKYTNLKDKNDKEIYVDDIIRINLSRLYIVKFGEYIAYNSVAGLFYRGNGFYMQFKYKDIVEGETEEKIFTTQIPLVSLREGSVYEIMGNANKNLELMEEINN